MLLNCGAGEDFWESLEKEMATHSGILASKIPWMENPGRLQSMGRKVSDTTEQLHFHFPVFLPGKSHGQRSLVGYSACGCKELDMTERLPFLSFILSFCLPFCLSFYLWTTRRSNQSILKEVNPEYSLETDAEAEAPIIWPPDPKSQLIEKAGDVGKHWGEEEKGTTEDEIVGWHYWLIEHEFE